MRGSHSGSFEAAHSLRDGKSPGGAPIDTKQGKTIRVPIVFEPSISSADIQAMGGRRWDTSSLVKRLR